MDAVAWLPTEEDRKILGEKTPRASPALGPALYAVAD